MIDKEVVGGGRSWDDNQSSSSLKLSKVDCVMYQLEVS